MTTKVTTEACCSDDKEVYVNVFPSLDLTYFTTKVLQDGETHEVYIYDKMSVSVQEVDKAELKKG